MDSLPRRRAVQMANIGPPPSQRVSPFKELGAAGFAVFGGRIANREKGTQVFGPQRWITYSDMVSNTSIVAAGVRYFLNIVASAKWQVKPNEKKGGNEEAAEFIDSVLNGMTSPWRRVARRAASYRFMGFGVQEWTAKRREKDGKIALDDVESRPQHTIDKWQVDEKGSVLGVYQVAPQTNQEIYLPRQKIMYLVEDSLTDSPEGLGLYRHLVEPYERLKKYLLLEGQGFERDLRGIPIGRVPYQALRAAVSNGSISSDDAARMIAAIESFVKIQAKSEDTSIVLDSAPYVVETEGGKSISGIMQYGLELLQGQSADFANMGQAIERLNREMARIIGAEHLLLGGEGSANRALAEDKSRNFYQVVNGTLDDIVDATNKDIIGPICDLNGIAEEDRPKMTHSDISFRSVQEITSALRDMATAGATLQPNDPAIEDVREMLGIQAPPEMTPELMGFLTGLPQEKDEEGRDMPMDPKQVLADGKDKPNGRVKSPFPPKKVKPEDEEEEEAEA